MMTHSVTRIFEDIAGAIEITPERHVIFNGANQMLTAEGSMPAASSEIVLKQTLQNLVYRVFYCRDTQTPAADPSLPEWQKRQDFMEKLHAANQSKEHWDKNWRVEFLDQWGGGIWATKSGWKRLAAPGDFIRENPQRVLEEGALIRFFVRPESAPQPGEGFFFVFGEVQADDNPSQGVRFYFNLHPEGSPALIRLLTTLLNEFQIPFQFKCLADPSAYRRCDSAVLYLDKRFAQVASEVLASLIFPELQPDMKPDVPTWTLALAPGIGFAESPPNPAESFGMQRSRLVVQGIMNAFKNQLPKSQWAATIQAEFAQRNYRLDQLHLNPFSHFPYNFDAWKKYH